MSWPPFFPKVVTPRSRLRTGVIWSKDFEEYLSKRRARTAARQELARQAKLALEAKPDGRKTLTEKWLLRNDAGRQYGGKDGR